MSSSNQLTQFVLEHLLRHGVFAWRSNTAGVLDQKRGIYRPAPKTGISDIIAIFPPHGRFIGIEIKVGRDKQRPDQLSFQRNVENVGGIYKIITSEEEYLDWYEGLKKE